MGQTPPLSHLPSGLFGRERDQNLKIITKHTVYSNILQLKPNVPRLIKCTVWASKSLTKMLNLEKSNQQIVPGNTSAPWWGSDATVNKGRGLPPFSRGSNGRLYIFLTLIFLKHLEIRSMDTSEIISLAVASYDERIQLKEKQIECLKLIIDGSEGKFCDVIVALPTGYGKSLIYNLLPFALRTKRSREVGSCLVICPLNLIQSDQMRSLDARGISSCRLSQDCVVTTLKDREECQVTMSDVIKGSYDLIFATPKHCLTLKKEKNYFLIRHFRSWYSQW